MFLLDTNVISELRKAGDGKADANVMSWLLDRDASDFYISVVTLFELEMGVLRMERRDPDQGTRLRMWLRTRILPEFTDRTLPLDAAVATRCAKLHVPDPRPERDAYIAATALVHGMTIVTRNVADFSPCGVSVVNPWEPAAAQ
ncbi:type II toxin-antitoxin system VapC family toxin [Caballeronia sp. BR00000012568055]|uniref:type II toxin-antitoxin system VapC family toxin n=1 Tax=Caballeronia sp. BR00000012568055 TaxID=2918761 RepID=UPI0023F69A2A|nr:type II toxin-antitoxin system VapC family toxin [Caballeronia sp. BR00000012568055]